jgi:hypothetical protein
MALTECEFFADSAPSSLHATFQPHAFFQTQACFYTQAWGQLWKRFSLTTSLTPLLVLIAAISVHDAWLVVLNDQVIAEFERNPIGRWLIELNSGSVHLFVTVKLIGTSLVCGVLSTLHDSAPRIGRLVTWPIACFQLALLTYLYTF